MKNFANKLTTLALAVAAAVLLAAPAKAGERHRGPAHAYDGLWSVSIRTQTGPCDPSYRYPARIVAGQIVPATNDFSYQISGNVVSNGAHRRHGEPRPAERHRLRPAARRLGRRPLERRRQYLHRHLDRDAPGLELKNPGPDRHHGQSRRTP